MTYLHRGPRLPVRQVAGDAWPQQCLAEGFRRLRLVYEGRLKNALPGISHQYISKVLAGEASCSLTRFVQFLGPLDIAEREFVLEAWSADARPSEKPPLVEIAEATEATGEALGFAERVLAESTRSPNEIAELARRVRQAQRELEDVEQAFLRGKA